MSHPLGPFVRSLLVTLLLLFPFGCRTVANAAGGTVKVVADKIAPVAGGPAAGAASYYLIARDGSICRVPTDRYWETQIGSEVRCNWRASRAEAAQDTVTP